MKNDFFDLIRDRRGSDRRENLNWKHIRTIDQKNLTKNLTKKLNKNRLCPGAKPALIKIFYPAKLGNHFNRWYGELNKNPETK